MAIERARLPPAALLLNELLQMQARLRAARPRRTLASEYSRCTASTQAAGAEAAAIARRLAGALASGLPAATFISAARVMVAALDAEERCVASRERDGFLAAG